MRTNADNDNYVLPAKIKGLSSCYRQPPCVAFAFLLTADRLRAISSNVRIVVHSAVQFTHHSPVSSVVHACSGALTRTTMCLAGHAAVLAGGTQQPNYHCPHSSALSALFSMTPVYHQRTPLYYLTDSCVRR